MTPRTSALHIRLPFLFCFLLGLFLQPAAALDVPPLTGHINDRAGMLSAPTKQQLESSLAAFEAQDSTQIVVLTISSLEGDSLEDYALRVAEQWQIGQKGQDNGALLLVAKNDRKLRIEVGYGLEGKLTDLTAGRIIRDIIGPQFKNGNFDQGIINGVSAIMAVAKGEFTATASAPPASGGDSQGLLVFLMIGLLFIGKIFGRNKGLAAMAGGVFAPVIGFFALGPKWLIILALIPIGMIFGIIASGFAGAAASGRHSSHGGVWGTGGGSRSSGGFGGGFSGGGGGFGGGGASGGW